MRIAMFALLFPFACSLVACSASTPGSSSGTPASDAGNKDAEVASEAGSGPVGCNTLTQVGAQLTAAGDSTPQPDGTGGVFADGTYVLTEVKLHGLPPAIKVAASALTVNVAGKLMNTVTTNAAGEISRTTYTLDITGAAFKLTETCKVSNATTSGTSFDGGQFTVDSPTAVRLFVPLSGSGATAKGELVLAKR
jgi:hypothetical protein